MRPSAAIRTAYSVASAVSASGGSLGQTLCASSITISTGCRSARRSHSVPSTAPATSACSSWLPSEPRSSTRQRASPSEAIADSPVVARPHAPAVDAEVADALRERARLRPRAADQVLERLRPRVVDHGVELGVLLAVGHRVEPQHRRLGLAAELAQSQAQARIAVAAADVDPSASARQRSRGRLVDAVAHLAQADHVGVRVEDHDPQARLQQQLLEHDAERVASCRSPTGRRRTCGGRSRRRRARTGRRARAAARRPAAARAPARPPSHAATSSGVAGADRGVVERPPSPERITPSPHAARIASLLRTGGPPPVPSHPTSAASTCSSRIDSTCPSRGAPSLSSIA